MRSAVISAGFALQWIVKITWDPLKRDANLDGRGLDFAMVTSLFFDRAKVVPAKKSRFLAFGEIDGKIYAVVFKPLGTEAISVISLRRASPKERRAL